MTSRVQLLHLSSAHIDNNNLLKKNSNRQGNIVAMIFCLLAGGQVKRLNFDLTPAKYDYKWIYSCRL